MAQAQNYGAAQPILDSLKKLGQSVGVVKKDPASEPKAVPFSDAAKRASEESTKQALAAEAAAHASKAAPKAHAGASYEQHSASRKARLARKYGSAEGPSK